MITSGGLASTAATACLPEPTAFTQCWSSVNMRERLSLASSLSSTMRIDRPEARGSTVASIAVVAATAWSTASGSLRTSSVPRPGPSLRARTQPPWLTARSRTRARPIPIPPRDPCSVRPAWTNGSKMESRSRGSTPAPLSRTLISQATPAFRTPTCTSPPGWVNLSALLTRFPTIWTIRAASASTQIGWEDSEEKSATPRSSKASFASSQTRRNGSRASIRVRRSSIFPCAIRAMSRRSSTSRVRCSAWRWRMARARRAVSPSGGARSSSAMLLRRDARGFRSSCDSTARNSVFRRASMRSASSAVFRAVTSCA